MARKKIYETEEQRLEARRGSKRGSYYRRTEKEGKPARIAILLKENDGLKNKFESMFLELKADSAEIKSLLLKILAKQ